MDNLKFEEIAEKYNNIENIWDENDLWHMWTHKMIKLFIKDSICKIPDSNKIKILNAGSGGYSYNLREEQITHIDIAEQKLAHLQNALIGNIENIPMENGRFELAICVGSVINYCDPVKVMSELARVVKNEGYIILEFENSKTLELLFKRGFKKNVAFTETFYNGKKEKLWFFSEEYIKDLARLYKLEILQVKRCHIISPLVYRICGNERKASSFRFLDKFFTFIPFIRKFSSNTIIFFKKSSENVDSRNLFKRN